MIFREKYNKKSQEMIINWYRKRRINYNHKIVPTRKEKEEINETEENHQFNLFRKNQIIEIDDDHQIALHNGFKLNNYNHKI